METHHITLGYLANMQRDYFDKLRNAKIVGEINAKQFVNKVVGLVGNNPLYGKADLFDVVLAEHKRRK